MAEGIEIVRSGDLARVQAFLDSTSNEAVNTCNGVRRCWCGGVLKLSGVVTCVFVCRAVCHGG